ncbi:hypothetical protein THRCLA_09581 [Thraustotheca clavata]|uniref:Uncharacterized protein n=1 Tax=Thraustotheca clavata TaxID=74557 RepID=A0A1V9YVV0_9STRA|nr:hypothetical protein THRCLA_09581 [Thraustotheca clavata]
MLWVEQVTGAFLLSVLIFCVISAQKLNQLELPRSVFSYSSPFAFYFHAIFRLSTLALYIIVLVKQFADYGITMISYYTIWNFILQMIYYIWAIKYQYTTAQSRYEPVTTTKEILYLNMLFDVCFSNSILVDIVFWAFLYYPGMSWYGYVEHGGNTIAFFVEFMCNHFLISRKSWFFTIFFAAIYSTFVWISYATWLDHEWPYFFLSMDTPYAPLWHFGIFGGHVLTFGGAIGLSKLKEYCLPDKQSVPVSFILPQAQNRISYV